MEVTAQEAQGTAQGALVRRPVSAGLLAPTFAYRPRTLVGVGRRLVSSPRTRGPILGTGALLASGGALWVASALGLGLGGLALWLPWLNLLLLWIFLFTLMPALLLITGRIQEARKLWSRAVLVTGHVEEARPLTLSGGEAGAELTFRYTDADGVAHQKRLFAPWSAVPQVLDGAATSGGRASRWRGAPLLVAYDRADPGAAVVPALEADSFEVVRREDRRPALGPASHGVREAASAWAQRTPLFERPASRRWRRRRQLGLLSVDDERMVLEVAGPQGQAQRREVLWARPFVVLVSAWIVSNERVDVHVQVRQRGLAAHVPSVGFSVRLAQSAVDRQIPIKEEHLGYLSQEAFASLWEALRHYAEVHGEPLAARFALGDLQGPRRLASPPQAGARLPEGGAD